MLKFCERPTAVVRFRFDDGEWKQTSGPEFLKRLKANASGHVSVDSVIDTAPASNGHAEG